MCEQLHPAGLANLICRVCHLELLFSLFDHLFMPSYIELLSTLDTFQYKADWQAWEVNNSSWKGRPPIRLNRPLLRKRNGTMCWRC